MLPTYSEGTLTGFFIAGKRIQINTDSADGRLGNYLVIRDAKRNVIGVSAIDQTASNSAFALTKMRIAAEVQFNESELRDRSLGLVTAASIKLFSTESSGWNDGDGYETAPKIPQARCEFLCDLEKDLAIDMCDALQNAILAVAGGFTGYACSIPGACLGGAIIGTGIGVTGVTLG